MSDENPLVSDEFDALFTAALRFADNMDAWLEFQIDQATRDQRVVTTTEIGAIADNFVAGLEWQVAAAFGRMLGERDGLSVDEARELAGRLARAADAIRALSAALRKTADQFDDGEHDSGESGD